MNEFLFFLHIFLVISFSLFMLRLGKETLITWIVLQGILANLFVLKQIDLFGFQVTTTDTYIVGGVFGLNLLQEFWGKEEARKVLSIQIVSILFFLLMGLVQVHYLPSTDDTLSSSYAAILSWMPRILLASLVTFFFVQRWDLFFFGWLKTSCPFLSLTYRNGLALLCSQVIDTFLFTFLGLYGIIAAPLDVLIVSLLVKGAVILFATPFTRFARYVHSVSV